MSENFPNLLHDRELQNGFEYLLRAFEIMYDEYEKEHTPKLDKEFLHMNRYLWAQETAKLFVRLYEEPDLDESSLPEWMQEVHGAVRRVAVRLLRHHRDVTPAEARYYFEGAASMLAVAVEQMRQVKKY
jgi:hypothetical protein